MVLPSSACTVKPVLVFFTKVTPLVRSGARIFAPSDSSICGCISFSGVPVGSVTVMMLSSPSVVNSPALPSSVKEWISASVDSLREKSNCR